MNIPDHMNWHQAGRLVMSLHFGLYSIPARGEWVRSAERLTVEQYQPFFDSFNPDRSAPAEWAKLAKVAGAKYVLLTTKHHDGFCLFDSKLTQYKVTNTPYGRDLIRDYVEAVRAEGLKVGLYYSLVDWQHPDCPAFGDRQHPLRYDPAAKDRDAKCNWSRYVKYLHGQVEELMSNYGTIDVLAFDFSYWDYAGEKWGATELMKTIRRLQPNVIVNDRLSNESLKGKVRQPFTGDLDHVEQNIPREPVRNANGELVPFEAWFTVGNSWSFDPHDKQMKSSAALVRALVNCVSKGGNLLLNVAPDARGHISKAQSEPIEQLGQWLCRNGESIYGCGLAEFPKPEWGRFTQNGKWLYAHVLEPAIGHITLPEMRGRVKNGRVLATGNEAILTDFWNPGVQTFDSPDDIFFNFGKPVHWTYGLPDWMDTVVRFELTSEAERVALVEKYRRDFDQAMERKPY